MLASVWTFSALRHKETSWKPVELMFRGKCVCVTGHMFNELRQHWMANMTYVPHNSRAGIRSLGTFACYNSSREKSSIIVVQNIQNSKNRNRFRNDNTGQLLGINMKEILDDIRVVRYGHNIMQEYFQGVRSFVRFLFHSSVRVAGRCRFLSP